MVHSLRMTQLMEDHVAHQVRRQEEETGIERQSRPGGRVAQLAAALPRAAAPTALLPADGNRAMVEPMILRFSFDPSAQVLSCPACEPTPERCAPLLGIADGAGEVKSKAVFLPNAETRCVRFCRLHGPRLSESAKLDLLRDSVVRPRIEKTTLLFDLS